MVVVRERPLTRCGNEVMRLSRLDSGASAIMTASVDHAAGGIEVAPHPLRIHDQTLEHVRAWRRRLR